MLKIVVLQVSSGGGCGRFVSYILIESLTGFPLKPTTRLCERSCRGGPLWPPANYSNTNGWPCAFIILTNLRRAFRSCRDGQLLCYRGKVTKTRQSFPLHSPNDKPHGVVSYTTHTPSNIYRTPGRLRASRVRPRKKELGLKDYYIFFRSSSVRRIAAVASNFDKDIS